LCEKEAETPGLIVNTGTLEKTEGTSASTVGVPVANQDSVAAQEGQLNFSGGGSDTTGAWSASEGATVGFTGGSFSLEGGSWSGAISVASKASVTLEGLAGKAAQVSVGEASLGVQKGSVVLKSLSITREGTVTGAGTLEVAGSLSWRERSTMSGSGSTVILPGGSGKLEVSSILETLNLSSGRRLVNEGTLTFASGTIWMTEGAEIKNSGTFKQNTETLRQNCQICFPGEKETEGPGLVVNTGTLEKTEGASASTIGVPIENQGTVSVQKGQLNFSSGGSDKTGEWSASEGASLNFTGGSFLLEGGSWSGAVNIASKAAVAVEGLSGKGAQVAVASASLSVQSGSVTVGGLAVGREGTIAGAGTLNVASTFSWKESSTMSGTGTTVLLPGAMGKMEVSGILETLNLNSGRSLVNEGTLTFASGTLWMTENTAIKNSGTFKQNTETLRQNCQICFPGEKETEGPAIIINTGIFEKTEGSGTSTVSVPFENLGSILEQAGTLVIKDPVTSKSSLQWGGGNPSGPGQAPPECGDPIDCATGNFFETQADLAVGGRGIGLDLTRTYNSQAGAASIQGAFGYGWSSSFSDRLVIEKTTAILHQGNGSTVSFIEGGGESFTSPAWSQDSLRGSAKLGYSVVLANQLKYQFDGATGRLVSVSDRNGNQTKIAYAAKGLMETITDPAGRKITLAYNAEGLVESAKDPMGHTVKYTYEGGNLISVTLPGEAKARWQYGYDGSHQMTSMTDGRAGKTTNEYDEAHRVKTQTDPAEHKLTFEYEPFHTKITNNTTGSVTDEHFTSNNLPFSITHGFGTASATTETFTYDTQSNLASVTDGNGHKTEYTYDGAADRTSMVDPNKNETKWTYDGTHDVLTATDPNGEKTTITRDSRGNAETVSRPAPHGTTQTTTYHYDTNGNLTSTVDALKHTWSYEYNNQGDCTSSTDPEGDKRTYGYNEDSQRTSIVSPAGNVKGAEASQYTTKIERDARGRPTTITDPLGHTTKYVYDGDGNVETMTDANTHTTTFTYNADNRLTKVKEPSGITTETGYDGAGRVTSQTDGNKHTTTYTRNILGEVTEVKDPLGRITKKEYDAAGNLTAVIDAAKRTTKYFYDPANRLKEVSYSESKTPAVKYEYDADGNRTKMTDGTGKTSYTYDLLDRLVQSVDGHGDTTGYEYDLNDKQTKLTYPGGNLLTRTYDNTGRLQSVADWLKNTTTFAYNPNSDLTTTTFPKGTGEQDKTTYNNADQQMKITMTGNGLKVLASVAYTRDNDGQIKSTTTTGLPGTESTSSTYDTNNRLEKTGSTAYAYDSVDEPTTLGSNTSVYDAAGELKTSGSNIYGYDPLGHRISTTPKGGQATVYAYDQAGNLVQAKQGKANGLNVGYAYNGDGLRASQTKGKATSFMTWDTQVELPSILSDEQNSYIYGPANIPIEEIQSKGVVLYLHHDQQGSTRMLTSATGATEATITYDAYGNTTGATGNTVNPLGYDGQYTNADTGLIYLRARAYDPSTAQFVSADPIEAITGQPYTYAADNPFNALDPSGLSACGSIIVISTICNGLQETGISNAAAGALNVITFGTSNELAGEVFGFNSECANYGTAGDIGAGLAFGFGLFDGESEAELAAAGADTLASTGRTVAADLREQLAMEEAQSYPAAGLELPVRMSDPPRWTAEEGWVKMSQNVNGVEIHYVRNTLTGAVEDFKFIGGAP
jgi:RHS repeat-associated protein